MQTAISSGGGFDDLQPPASPGYAMIRVRQRPILAPDIRSIQVDRFIRRMRLVGEGETRLLIAIEDDEGTTLSVSLPVGRLSKVSV